MSLIDAASSIDWADTTINQYNSVQELREQSSCLNKLMRNLKRANTDLRNKEEELEQLKQFSWFQPEYENYHHNRIAKCQSKIENLQDEYAYQKKNIFLDRIQKASEIADLFFPGINTKGTIGVSAVKAIQCAFFAKEGSNDPAIKMAKAKHLVKEIAISGTKLAAKAAFDYLLPNASPYVSYLFVNAGEKLCGMLAERWSGQANMAQLKRDAVNTALKIAATVTLAQCLSVSANSVIPGAS
ncbi:MAG: hypothetical protein LLG04_18460 [Parachlamydia sp.]|nr:hypothetical protein [Parachlamydia sp.]